MGITYKNIARLLVVAIYLSGLPISAQTVKSRISHTAHTAPSGNLITVPSGGNLQTAINSAVGGDVILLEAGGSWTGNYTLKSHTGSDYVTIIGGGTLPPLGTRVTPGYVSGVGDWAELHSPSSDPLIYFENNSDYWAIIGVDILPNGGTPSIGTAVQIGNYDDSVAANYPDHIIIDRVVVRGDATTGQKRGLSLHGSNMSVLSSYIYDIKNNDEDAQALWINGPGPYTVTNNYLQSTGENFLIGGANIGVENQITEDVEFSYNELEKPDSWLFESWSIKNIFEVKQGRRIHAHHNIIHGLWPDSQAGYSVLFTVRSQDGDTPWSVIEDSEFTCNEVYDVSSGINLLGSDNENPSGNLDGLLIENNLVVASAAAYGGDGRPFQSGRNPINVTVDNNTFIGDGTSMIYLTDRITSGATGWVFTDNIWGHHNDYGLFGDGQGTGTTALNYYLSGYTYTGNVMGGGSGGDYPMGNTALSDAAWDAIFVDFAGGDYRVSNGTYTLKGKQFGC